MITRKRLLCSVVPAGVALIALLATCIISAPRSPAAESTVSSDPFSGPPRSEAQQRADQKLFDQRQWDERQITIRQANLFHARFIETVMSELPPRALLLYAGRLRTDDGARYGFRKKAGVGNPLGWHVQGEGMVTFSFWISTQRTTETVVETEVEMQKLFVNVSHVNANRGLDIPLPELGGLTVRQTLAKLNKPWPAPPDGPGEPNGS